MLRDNNMIAIDIGNKLIKVVYGKLTSKGVSIIDYGCCNTPKNSFLDGNISDRSDIIKVLSDLIKSINIKSKNVIMGVKGQDIIIRHIEMPIISDKQLKQAAKLEIQQYLPMDPNEYNIDSKKIDMINTKEKKVLNVLLVAAPKKKIDNYIYISEKLDLKAKTIDLFANSITKFFIQDYKNIKRCIGMVDIGYHSTTITIIENGKLFLEKEIDIGIKDIDYMLHKVFAQNLEEIDIEKRNIISLMSGENNLPNDDPRIYYANNTAKQIVDQLLENIVKIIDFYISSGINRKVDCLYLYGGGSKIIGIVEYLSSSINVETRLFSTDLISNVKNIDDIMKDNLFLYLNCISLLLRRDE